MEGRVIPLHIIPFIFMETCLILGFYFEKSSVCNSFYLKEVFYQFNVEFNMLKLKEKLLISCEYCLWNILQIGSAETY